MRESSGHRSEVMRWPILRCRRCLRIGAIKPRDSDRRRAALGATPTAGSVSISINGSNGAATSPWRSIWTAWKDHRQKGVDDLELAALTFVARHRIPGYQANPRELAPNAVMPEHMLNPAPIDVEPVKGGS